MNHIRVQGKIHSLYWMTFLFNQTLVWHFQIYRLAFLAFLGHTSYLHVKSLFEVIQVYCPIYWGMIILWRWLIKVETKIILWRGYGEHSHLQHVTCPHGKTIFRMVNVSWQTGHASLSLVSMHSFFCSVEVDMVAASSATEEWFGLSNGVFCLACTRP